MRIGNAPATPAGTLPGMIRPATVDDARDIAAIYNHYVTGTVITFEEERLPEAELRARLVAVQGHRLPWLVLEQEGAVAGYAYASPWRTRSAYRFCVETTVYMAPQCTGQGLGLQLYRRLLDALQPLELHSAIGVIALPNAASVRTHEKLGFAKVGELKQVGWKFERWIDVGYWQLLLRQETAG